jgi:hypothetical protein
MVVARSSTTASYQTSRDCVWRGNFLYARCQVGSAFDCFCMACWFGQDVLWLDPEQAQPRRRLTPAVWRAFPQHPPAAAARGTTSFRT